MLELNDTTYKTHGFQGVSILAFYADWCPLCPMVLEKMSQLETEMKENIQFLRINFDQNPDAVKYYGAIGVPLVLAIKDNRTLHGWGGLVNLRPYRDYLEYLLTE